MQLLPILHAGGIGWDEILILVVAILAVPAFSWLNGVRGRGTRIVEESAPPDEFDQQPDQQPHDRE